MKMMEEGRSKEEIAAYTIEFIRATLEALTANALELYGRMPVLYAGGVMSCRIIRESMEKNLREHLPTGVFVRQCLRNGAVV